MYQLTKVSAAIAAVGLSTVLFVGQSNAVTNEVTNDSVENSAEDTAQETIEDSADESTELNDTNAINESVETNDNINNNTNININDISPVTNGVSEEVASSSKTVVSSNKFLPTIKYSTQNSPVVAQKVNSATWKEGSKIDRNTGTRLQALLNWHQNGVGAVDGYWGKNTRKAMQAFQQANGLKVTDTLNSETWQALTKNDKLMAQPVLVSYELTDADINIKTTTIPTGAEAKAKLEGMYYETVLEGLAEKFRISEGYLKTLNPNAKFAVGETITVYNPGNPNTKPVSRVIADKITETLYAYDDKGNLVASYPTTVGSTAMPSPTGIHKVEVKVHEPNYTYTAENGSKSILPPGPNNPVGLVWIGLSKPSYGIHGSPDPARISRQASAGCIRLTNWDALALLGVIQNGASVEFK